MFIVTSGNCTCSSNGPPTREHRYYSRTKALCPLCERVVDAKVVERDGCAYLDKHCPQHGRFRSLVSTSFTRYIGTGAELVNGRIPGEFATEVHDGCPMDCGYCPQHEQHACTGLIEITDHCNISCPICYANCQGSDDIPLSDFKNRLDALERVEGRIDILQISGGEPTLHPQLMEFLAEGRCRKPNRILLNTNGRRIARESAFVEQLAEFRDILDIYLQYDGPSAAANIALRGSDLREEKQQAIRQLHRTGLKTILVATVCGENLDDVPAIVQTAAHTEGITGVTFQTLSYCGRNSVEKGVMQARQRITTPQIIESLCRLPWIKPSDVFPLPCSHPYCTQLCYLHCRPGRKPFSLIRLTAPREIVGTVKNRLSFNSPLLAELRPKIRCVTFKTPLRFSNILPALAARRFFNKSKGSEWKGEKILRIVIKQFMDAETFDASRAARCCIGVVTKDARVVPFCSYNTIHRKRACGT